MYIDIDVLITELNENEELSVFEQNVCFELKEEIKASNKDNINQHVHIHNYSLSAAKAFIAEVKKHPIIYECVQSRNNIPLCTNAFTNFAWSRIVTSLIGDHLESNLNQRHYWEKSFQELWNWMRFVFEKDMRDQSRQFLHTRSLANSWLCHMKFLESYIRLRDTTSDTDTEINSDISVQDNNIEASRIYWLNHPNEPIETKGIYISICIRNPIDLSLNCDYKGKSGTSVEPTLSNQFNEHQINTIDLTDTPSNQSNTPSSPTSSLKLPVLPFDEIKFEDCIIEEIDISPQPNSGKTLDDEDCDFIMSFLPLLKQFKPDKSVEVKLMLIKALTEDY